MYISMKRSFKANYFEYITWKSKTKEKYIYEDLLRKFLEERRIENEKEYILPEVKFVEYINKEYFLGREVFTISYNKNKKAILYLHGGGYVNKANINHFNFGNNVAKNMDYDFIIPLYPLAPNHFVNDAHIFLMALYKSLIERYSNIVLMGDSAGGGLAYSILESIYTNNIKKPDKIITFSPWVDISMENENIKFFESKDPMISSFGLKEIGKLWAREMSVYDSKCSPIYANDLRIFENSYIFVGTREIFYPDIKIFINKLKEKCTNINEYIFTDMNHVFAIVNDLPESRKVLLRLKDILSK